MNKIVSLLTIILLLSGCITSSVCGVYGFDGAILVLHDDQTYLYTPKDSDTIQKGTFGIYDHKVELTNVLGMTTTLTITNDGLVDDKGKLWRRR
jgi:hypothetical protein